MATLEIEMPALGQSVAEGTVVRWLKQPGDVVTADESVVIVQTDKAETEIPAPRGGHLAEVLVPEGHTVDVGTALARLATDGAAAPTADAARETAAASATTAPARAPSTSASPPVPGIVARPRNGSFLSPAVRKLAREHALSVDDVLSVAGTGRGGRVTHADLSTWLKDRPAREAESAPAVSRAPADTRAGDETVIPLEGLRLKIAEHLAAASRDIPHVNTITEVDLSNIVSLRRTLGPEFAARHGFKLSFNAFFLHAVSRTLLDFPTVNAILDERGIVTHRGVDLGMAVALEPSGLVVPVLRGADGLTLRALAVEAKRLGDRARGRTLTADEMAGGTCTVTNPGVFGTLLGTPIIHRPQAAIVDFGAIKKRVVVTEDDAIAIRPMAFIVLAWDHRVMDGATASRFLQALVRKLESYGPDALDG